MREEGRRGEMRGREGNIVETIPLVQRQLLIYHMVFVMSNERAPELIVVKGQVSAKIRCHLW